MRMCSTTMKVNMKLDWRIKSGKFMVKLKELKMIPRNTEFTVQNPDILCTGCLKPLVYVLTGKIPERVTVVVNVCKLYRIDNIMSANIPNKEKYLKMLHSEIVQAD